MSYGAITRTDATVLETVLRRYRDKSCVFLEIGVWNGETARGVKEFCDTNNIRLEYWGIDPNKPDGLFPNANFVQGVSEEVSREVPNALDVVFVDGCHCLNHVILDAIHYSRKLNSNGFILFHDAAPHIQHVQTNKWVHGNDDKPIHRTAVLDALCLIGWPNSQFNQIEWDFEEQSDIGGMIVFHKMNL